MHAKSLQSCPTLSDPKDCSPQGSSVQGILQARILLWFVTPFSRGSSHPRITPTSLLFLALAGRFFITTTIMKLNWTLGVPGHETLSVSPISYL